MRREGKGKKGDQVNSLMSFNLKKIIEYNYIPDSKLGPSIVLLLLNRGFDEKEYHFLPPNRPFLSNKLQKLDLFSFHQPGRKKRGENL